MNVSEAFKSISMKTSMPISDHVLRNGVSRESNSSLKLLPPPSCHAVTTRKMELVKAKLRLGAKILQGRRGGGVEKGFRRIFSVREGELLFKASQCCLYTTAGPIQGRLFNVHHCFDDSYE